MSTLEARPSVAELPFFNTALYAETRFSLRVGKLVPEQGYPYLLGRFGAFVHFLEKSNPAAVRGNGSKHSLC